MNRLIIALLGLFALGAPAAAQTPVAIVEDVQGKADGLELMDYVSMGKVIRLDPADTLVLGYLKSCWRETITGGTVIVGAEQSMVHLGDVQRVKVPCDASAVQIPDRVASQSAATTFRSARADPKAPPTVLPTLYGVSPLIEAKGGVLIIERIDAKGEQFAIPLKGNGPGRGRFYDFARAGKALTPGGAYLATLGARRFTFQVDAHATSGASPLVGRLLRLE